MALRLLAGRELSRAGLRRKLLARGHPAQCVEPTLDGFAAQGLQSDERFAEHYVAWRCARGYGPQRIAAELREQGIAPDLVARWLDPRAADWPQRLVEVAGAKYGTAPPADRREAARRARFLEQRGFPAELIRRHLFG